MPKSRVQKPTTKAVSDKTSDTVWAAITILSLPIAAMAFSAMDFNPFVAFILAACVTFAIIAIETVVRGKLWIFQDRFKETFGNPETPFRILIVTGGILLILQTLLIVQIFTNPDIDHFMLNVILRKQCDQAQGKLANTICPMFMPVRITGSYALRYSLEKEAMSHLLPTATLGACAIVPLKDWPASADSLNVQFFTYCENWNADGVDNTANSRTAIIQAELDAKTDGFYAARTWSENSDSPICFAMTNDRKLMDALRTELKTRKDALIRANQ